MSAAPPPARLHVLLAREAPIGLVIRHGPMHQVRTVLWDRRNDQFTLGQWLKGRIYEDGCDISPDGQHWIYGVDKGWQFDNLRYWTAVSRVPYLKALAFYPELGCHGGLFVANRRYFNYDGALSIGGYESREVLREAQPPDPVNLRIRDGWISVGRWQVFEKSLSYRWSLRRTDYSPRDQYTLAKGETVLSYPDWEWADIDRTRLAWASGGKLWAGRMCKTGLHKIKRLKDFNDMKFEAIEAPY